MARIQEEIEVWGTILFIDIASPDAKESDLRSALIPVRDYVHHVDEVFSTYKPASVISQLRRGEIKIGSCSAEVIEVWNLCNIARELTDGAFNPWEVAGGFDPSGLVKGWAADKCADILQEQGVRHISINAAGDITMRGGVLENGEVKPWATGVVNPEKKLEVVKVFETFDGAIATSGTYERGAHIHDPYTGLIAIGGLSATVKGPDGAMADALATALMVAGKDGAIWFSQPELANYEAWVVERDGANAWGVGPTTQ